MTATWEGEGVVKPGWGITWGGRFGGLIVAFRRGRELKGGAVARYLHRKLLAGGWRIIHTMGGKITKLDPMHGFGAETAGAAVIIGSTFFGIPVSTTHVIAGSIIGVGATRRLSAVRWGLARRIMWTWIITIPAASGMAAMLYFIFSLVM